LIYLAVGGVSGGIKIYDLYKIRIIKEWNKNMSLREVCSIKWYNNK
jgi:hypothetical protein